MYHRFGYGSAFAHHGEILQGVFEGSDGRLHRGLVSLPCRLYGSTATFYADESVVVSVHPPERVKARRAAELTFARHGVAGGGRLLLESSVPLRQGLGSSTSDVTTAIRTVADYLQIVLSEDVVAALAVEAEKASDSCMYGDRAILFAHREGVVLEDFGATLPPLDIVGFLTDITGQGVDTLSLPPARYTWWEVEAFRPLRGLLRRAIYTQDPSLIGLVASASARMNQRHVPISHFDEIMYLVDELEAVGLQVAHSGTVAGLLFATGEVGRQERITQARTALERIGFEKSWHFTTERVGKEAWLYEHQAEQPQRPLSV